MKQLVTVSTIVAMFIGCALWPAGGGAARLRVRLRAHGAGVLGSLHDRTTQGEELGENPARDFDLKRSQEDTQVDNRSQNKANDKRNQEELGGRSQVEILVGRNREATDDKNTQHKELDQRRSMRETMHGQKDHGNDKIAHDEEVLNDPRKQDIIPNDLLNRNLSGDGDGKANDSDGGSSEPTGAAAWRELHVDDDDVEDAEVNWFNML